MEESYPKLFSPKTLAIGIALTGLFFISFTFLIRPFVPSQDPLTVWLLSAYTSSCLTGVFFVAYHMFTAVLIDTRRRKR